MKNFFNMFGKKNKNRKKNEKEEPNISDLLDSPNFEGGKTKKNLCIKRSKFVGLVVFLSIVSAVIGAFCAKFLDRLIFNKYYNFPRELHIEGDTCGSGEAVGLKASLSVVGIKCEYVNKGSSGAFFGRLYENFPHFGGIFKDKFNFEEEDEEGGGGYDEEHEFVNAGLGSGVIYKIENDIAYVVTNFHVIKEALLKENSSTIKIYFGNNDKNYKVAQIIDFKPQIDIAVLSVPIKGERVVAADIGDSKLLNVGQEVYTIGSPTGIKLNSTLTHGIVSALDREIELEGIDNKVDVFQTDAALNPGNSGGGVFDKHGKLIGICIAKAGIIPYGGLSGKLQIEGISYCLPINIVKKYVETTIEKSNGETIKNEIPDIGLRLENISSGGAYVKSVVKDSAADRAGIKPGDQIIKIDGKTVKSKHHIDCIICSKDKKVAKFTIYRPVYTRMGAIKLKKMDINITF